ncbi:MAG: ATP-binding cassette domain-containing protein [Ruminiclostridium sp.]|nr:ATP-binding cassette domain-containing protein [Ruminiclostridium sp.]
MAFLKADRLCKEFISDDGKISALSDISFEVEKGEIFGIIGLSGAGKSTLVRCINRLEEPTSGCVLFKDRSINGLSAKELRKERRKIGMIFQHFNLLMQRSVLDNVALPLEIAGAKRKEAREKAWEYLEAVGIPDKANAFPSQLSGGQKQRVAIARVLASDPELLLCDEATSALDPQTTRQILALLRDINKKYGITILIITHAMTVVQEICDRVAVLEGGRLMEMNTVKELFAHPRTKAAKRLLLIQEDDNEEKEAVL